MGDISSKVTFGDIGGGDAVYGANVVEEIEGDTGRWMRMMTSIVEHEGRFFAVEWQSGLTEIQENELPPNDEVLVEVFPKTVLSVRKEIEWTESQDETEPAPILGSSDLDAFKVLGLSSEVEHELERLHDVDTSVLRKAIADSVVLAEDDGFDSFRKATLRFLEEFTA